jgi:general secretion pathway protein C
VDSAIVLTKLLKPGVLRPLSVLLAILVLYLLAGLIWQFVELGREAPLSTAITESRTQSVTRETTNYNVQALLAVPLFGVKPNSAVEQDPLSSENVKVSALKIKVMGLVAGNDEAGIAVLQYGSKTRAYAVGEKIDVPGDVRLLAVKADHVLIENNRRREKIELDKRPAVSGVSSSVAEQHSDVVDIHTPEIQALIGDPRETVQNSPLKLARFFAVSPVNEGGQLVGYSLAPGRDKRLFELLDIKSGDVLLSVNGQALADVSTPELLRMMEDTSSFELLVKRGDAILTKRLEL